MIILVILFLVVCICIVKFMDKDKYILDGPGMYYEPKWIELTVSGRGSLAEDNFSFTVTDNNEEAFVDGECVGYSDYDGIKLSSETVWALRRLNLEKLENVKKQDMQNDDDIIILDEGSRSLFITLPSGEVVEKVVSYELVREIYDMLLPYFENNN